QKMTLRTALLCLSLATTPAAFAQSPHGAPEPLDPLALIAGASDLVARAPDADIDRLFRAVHATSRNEAEARGLCALFEPGADRSLQGLQRAANALGEDSRARFVEALAAVAIGGLQNPPQPYDPAEGEQALKAAAVTASMLHEGFMPALNGAGGDAGARRARCNALRQLLDVLDGFEADQRVPATRSLLREGLARLGTDSRARAPVPRQGLRRPPARGAEIRASAAR